MPDTTGPPEFNRIFRAHQNTLEQMPSFLSSMWLCSIFVGTPPASAPSEAAGTSHTRSPDAKVAAALGSVWVLARVGYARAYRNAQSLGRWTIPCYLVVNSLSALTIIRVLRSFL